MKVELLKMKPMLDAVRPHWFAYGASTAAVSLRNYAINMLNAMLFSAIAYAARTGDIAALRRSAVRFLLLLMLFVAVDTLALHTQAVTVNKMTVLLRQTLYGKVLRMPMWEVYALGANAGDILSRLNSDMELVEEIFSMNLLYPIMLLISGVGGSVSILQISPGIWLYLVIVGLTTLAVKLFLSKAVYAQSKQRQARFSQMMTLLQQLCAHLPNLRLMNMTQPVIQEALRKVQELGVTLNRQACLNSHISFSTKVVDLAVYAGVTAGGLVLVRRGQMDLEQILFILQLAGMVTDLFLSLGDALVSLKTNLIGVERITEILTLPAEDLGQLQEMECHPTVEEFRIENLSVTFENGNRVVYPKEMRIPKDGITAICGDSGCGKSTLGRLLVGLRTGYSGKMDSLGVPLESYSLATLRRHITYVPQRDYFIQGTILENLLLGNDAQIAPEKVRCVAKALGCGEWIENLPEAYDHVIPHGATSLSGGQRQTLSILRGVLRGSQTLILDETFSHIDAGTIPVILKGLKALPQTVIVITHDRNVMQCCDHLLTLEQSI